MFWFYVIFIIYSIIAIVVINASFKELRESDGNHLLKNALTNKRIMVLTCFIMYFFWIPILISVLIEKWNKFKEEWNKLKEEE